MSYYVYHGLPFNLNQPMVKKKSPYLFDQVW